MVVINTKTTTGMSQRCLGERREPAGYRRVIDQAAT